MGDDSDRDKVLATLYLDLAKAYKEANSSKAIKLKARLEKEEHHKINEEKHPLYSHNKGKILTFSDKVMEMNEMMEDLFFDLSDASNESIKDIKGFSAEEVMQFNKRVVEKIRRQNKKK